MEPREHFRAGEKALADDQPLHAIAHGLLAWASLLGADPDPERDIYDAATRTPVLRLAKTKKTAAAGDAHERERPS